MSCAESCTAAEAAVERATSWRAPPTAAPSPAAPDGEANEPPIDPDEDLPWFLRMSDFMRATKLADAIADYERNVDWDSMTLMECIAKHKEIDELAEYAYERLITARPIWLTRATDPEARA